MRLLAIVMALARVMPAEARAASPICTAVLAETGDDRRAVPPDDVDQAAAAEVSTMAPTADKPVPREETPQTVTPSTTPPAKRARRPAGRPRPGQDTGEERLPHPQRRQRRISRYERDHGTQQ
jgi:hypothetical protein